MADSPMLLAWSVMARIWAEKNSDWIRIASCGSLALISLSQRSNVAATLRCMKSVNCLA
jgi:hypothetical protein